MTHAQQAAFLEELGTSGNLAFACRAADVTRSEALAHRDAHPTFERLWRRMVSMASRSAAARAWPSAPVVYPAIRGTATKAGCGGESR